MTVIFFGPGFGKVSLLKPRTLAVLTMSIPAALGNSKGS